MKKCTKISDLPAWLRVKAKTNIALEKGRGGRADDRKEDRLLCAFMWSLTPEGADYWSRINKGNIPEKPNNMNLEEFFSPDKDDIEYKKVEANMVIAANLNKVLNHKGYDNGTFASIMNVTPDTVTKWLSGIHVFNINEIVEINERLHIQLIDTNPLINP